VYPDPEAPHFTKATDHHQHLHVSADFSFSLIRTIIARACKIKDCLSLRSFVVSTSLVSRGNALLKPLLRSSVLFQVIPYG